MILLLISLAMIFDIPNILLAGLTAVTGALVWSQTKLWEKAEGCEKDRTELRKAIEELRGEEGEASGKLEMFERCPHTACPFAKK